MAQRANDWNLPGFAVVERDAHGLDRISVTTPFATGEIYLHGAHVTRFQPRGRDPVLFVSRQSLFQKGKAIRGGIPLIFPWFGPNAENRTLPAHGFARTSAWKLESIKREGDDAVVELSLAPTPESSTLWPHRFHLGYQVRIGVELHLELTTQNVDFSSFHFEEAFHTYLAVGDVRRATIAGLADRDYFDKTQGGKQVREGRAPIQIVSETDRVYVPTTDPVIVDDPANSRQLRVSKTGSDATVVWNPWVAKAKALTDFGDDEWPEMLCIESGNIGQAAVTLAPGQAHTISAVLSAQGEVL